MARVREPVPVFHFLQYGKQYSLSISSRTRFSFPPLRETIFVLNIFPYPFLISSSTGNHVRSLYLPVPVFHFFPYGKPYSLSISSRTRFSFLPVRETKFALNVSPYPFFMSSSTGNYIRSLYLPVPVREEMKNGYGKVYYNVYRFPYWKNLNTGTGSRTGINEKRVRVPVRE